MGCGAASIQKTLNRKVRSVFDQGENAALNVSIYKKRKGKSGRTGLGAPIFVIIVITKCYKALHGLSDELQLAYLVRKQTRPNKRVAAFIVPSLTETAQTPETNSD